MSDYKSNDKSNYKKIQELINKIITNPNKPTPTAIEIRGEDLLIQIDDIFWRRM